MGAHHVDCWTIVLLVQQQFRGAVPSGDYIVDELMALPSRPNGKAKVSKLDVTCNAGLRSAMQA